MKHAQFSPIADVTVSPLGSTAISNPGKGLLSRFVGALRESRRLQAAQIIERHRHLIDQAHKTEATKTAGASSPGQQVFETANATGSPSMWFNAKLIMAIVLAGFIVLHFGADAILRHASAAAQPVEDNMPLPNRD